MSETRGELLVRLRQEMYHHNKCEIKDELARRPTYDLVKLEAQINDPNFNLFFEEDDRNEILEAFLKPGNGRSIPDLLFDTSGKYEISDSPIEYIIKLAEENYQEILIVTIKQDEVDLSKYDFAIYVPQEFRKFAFLYFNPGLNSWTIMKEFRCGINGFLMQLHSVFVMLTAKHEESEMPSCFQRIKNIALAAFAEQYKP